MNMVADEDVPIIKHELEIVTGHLNDVKQIISVEKNDIVSIIFSTDQAVEIHLHGYNLKRQIIPAGLNEMSFKANATGRFNITTHYNSLDNQHSTHGTLFESDTLAEGDTYVYQISNDLAGTTIYYHDQLDHDISGKIIVSNEINPLLKNTTRIISSINNEIIANPGDTLEWIVDKKDKMRITSGLPPIDIKHTHGDHKDNRSNFNSDQEAVLAVLEVWP
jgi:hypothetical protein